MGAATQPPLKPLLIIACGALAREIGWVLEANDLDDITLTCLPAELHNTPDRIPTEMRRKIDAAEGQYDRILALYGDCGTGGELDALLKEKGIERIDGAHCYAFYAGLDAFDTMHEDEIGTFYLTDYLVRFFDRLIIKGLGIDRHPELRDVYFGNYTRIMYLAQSDDDALDAQARAAAETLGLSYARRRTGYGGLSDFILDHVNKDTPDGNSDGRLLA
tara:strand:+ start:19109 stop:19762 length:654 start_codon:yes stop_codon:yes gene_type:complete